MYSNLFANAEPECLQNGSALPFAPGLLLFIVALQAVNGSSLVFTFLLFIMEGNGSDDQKALLIVFSKGPS